MNKTRKRPAWVRAARKAIAAHLPAIRKAMAEAVEPHDLAIVPRGMDWEDCADENAAVAKQMLRLVRALDAATRAAADAMSGHFNEVTGEGFDGPDMMDAYFSDGRWVDDAVFDRWQEAINELPEREDDV